MKHPLMLTVYGLANAVLYSAMLPLWEGFDEPFHFGYVQHLTTARQLPDPHTTFLSREVGSSILIAPASGVVRQNLPQVTTYSEYFSSPWLERAARQKQLREIRPDLRRQASDFRNYEAQQAPLAYILLAFPERMLARASLLHRVLVLRIIAALAGLLLLYFGADRLFSELGLPEAYRTAAAFCVLSCQMTWAAIAHVANDWLAVPLTVWSLTMMIRYWKRPAPGRAAWVAWVLSVGLVTKAYFVALVPLAIALYLLRRRWKDLGVATAILLAAAGPWYTRNVFRYGVITGIQESRTGIGATAMIHGISELDWPAAAVTSVRSALWTGNNTFMSFSSGTLAAIVAVWSVALILWALNRHENAEWIAVAYCGVFLAALGYMTVLSFVFTRGAATGPGPWHSQVLLAPMLGLAFLGSSRSDGQGKVVAAVLVLLFGYVLIATYFAKLIPLYGGYEGRTSLASLIALYSKRLPLLVENLDLIAFAPARIILGLATIVAGLAITQMLMLVRSLFERGGNPDRLPKDPFAGRDLRHYNRGCSQVRDLRH